MVRCNRRRRRHGAAKSEAGPTFRISGSIVVISSHPFQPKRRALAAADAQRDQRAFGLAPLQFLQARQHQPRAGRADRMAERNRAAVDVQFFQPEISPSGSVATKKITREFFRRRALQRRASTCAAKASLISIKSASAMFSPVCVFGPRDGKTGQVPSAPDRNRRRRSRPKLRAA